MRGSSLVPAVVGLAFAALVLAAPGAAAQGLPFFTPTGLPLPLAENGIRAFYQHVEVRTLLQNGSEIANPGALRVGVDAVPLTISAGVTPHALLMVVAPYLRKTFEQNGTSQTRSGLGDVTVMVRQDLHASDFVAGNRRLALFAGATLPTGATGGGATALPPPLRLGLGTLNLTGQAVYSYVNNRFGAHGAVGYTAATGDDFGVHAGDRVTYGLALGHRVAPAVYHTLKDRTFAAYLEFTGTVEQRSTQGGAPLPDTGGHTLFVAPGLQLLPLQNWALEASFQLPIVRALHGTQLAPTWSLAIGARAVLYLFGS